MVKNVTKTQEIANLYSSKSLLFINHLQWEEKLACQERSDFVCGRFIKVFYKTTGIQSLLLSLPCVHLQRAPTTSL